MFWKERIKEYERKVPISKEEIEMKIERLPEIERKKFEIEESDIISN